MKRNLMLALTLLALLAAGSLASAQTTITLYDPRPNVASGQLMDALVKEFEAKNPDIRIEHVHIAGYNQMNEKTLVAWAGGAAPNVVIVEQSRWFGFALDGMFLPLDNFIANDPTASMDDIYPGILNHLTWDGKLWGYPYNISTPLIYYNRDLFAMSGLDGTAPTTWDGILQTSRRIARDSNGDGENDVWGIDFYNWGWLFEAWLGQNGAKVASEDGRSYTFNSQEAIEAMEFTQALVREHRVARWGDSYAQFWAGNLGMAERSTASLDGNVKNANNSGFDMWVAPLACNTQCYAPIGGGNLHILNTGTDAQKEAAWRLVSFLTETENLARLGAATGYMAGRLSSIQSSILQDHFIDEPRAIVTYQQLIDASPRAKVPNWAGEMASAISALAARQHRDGTNVRDELNELVRYGNTLLDEWYASRDKR